MSRFKKALFWVSVWAVTVAGLLAGFPPSDAHRAAIWIGCAIVVIVFLPIVFILDKERRRGFPASKESTSSERDTDSGD
jgi:hypothetical protein